MLHPQRNSDDAGAKTNHTTGWKLEALTQCDDSNISAVPLLPGPGSRRPSGIAHACLKMPHTTYNAKLHICVTLMDEGSLSVSFTTAKNRVQQKSYLYSACPSIYISARGYSIIGNLCAKEERSKIRAAAVPCSTGAVEKRESERIGGGRMDATLSGEEGASKVSSGSAATVRAHRKGHKTPTVVSLVQ